MIHTPSVSTPVRVPHVSGRVLVAAVVGVVLIAITLVIRPASAPTTLIGLPLRRELRDLREHPRSRERQMSATEWGGRLAPRRRRRGQVRRTGETAGPT
jgi:hypothetical protein